MLRKSVLGVILLLCTLAFVVSGKLVQANTQYPGLTELESRVVSLVNGTNVYNYDLELERIALDHNISDYAFRSAGSTGANRTADWIKTQFESLGLDTHLESFQFTTWDLPSQPMLIVDKDGNASTVDDEIVVKSFQPAHFSWPISEKGVFSDFVILPLPDGVTHEQFTDGRLPGLNTSAWSKIDTTGKILLVGREVNNMAYRTIFRSKLSNQPPAALIYTYWYEWMSFTPPFFGSMSGHSLWSSKLPVGYISYEDGLLIRNMEASENVSAMVKIPAKIEDGVNYNVVGKLRGSTNPDKTIIISGHYDTVMDAGFCDNGAGTSGVIELARVFLEAARTGVYTPEQTLVFIAFTGEELGFVGAMNYVRQHKAEMKDITAVINLDCIGQGILTVSETVPDEKGIQLDEIVLKAAEDLGVPARSEDPGGSDQEAFGNPVSANILYYQDWGLDGGINDSARVISSTMLCSYPLFYSDKWDEGTPGWAHTAYDNSTSTTTLDWVTVDKLEGHARVAAVSVMRFLAEFYNPFMSEVIMGSAIAAVVVLIAAILERSKVKAALTKVYSDISYTVDAKEIVYVIILTAFLLFSSYALTARVVRMETIIGGVPQIVSARDFGYPFEMIRIPVQTSVTTTDLETALSQLTVVSQSSTLIILWEGLLLDIVLYLVLAFVVVYLLASISYRYSVGKMSETD
jgi:hypothetical protein